MGDVGGCLPISQKHMSVPADPGEDALTDGFDIEREILASCKNCVRFRSK